MSKGELTRRYPLDSLSVSPSARLAPPPGLTSATISSGECMCSFCNSVVSTSCLANDADFYVTKSADITGSSRSVGVYAPRRSKKFCPLLKIKPDCDMYHSSRLSISQVWFEREFSARSFVGIFIVLVT